MNQPTLLNCVIVSPGSGENQKVIALRREGCMFYGIHELKPVHFICY